MKIITNSLQSPEENIAFDEALLDYCEGQEGLEALRFWESNLPFVVLGYSNKVKTESMELDCVRDNIPILRRCSGGGTVLQGPGCLNYALVLDIKKREFQNISKTNAAIMSQIAEALSKVSGQKVRVKADTDLALDDKKFSGNAQRRRLKKLLFHGTILYNYNLSLISKYLRQPTKQPEYREQRNHKDFICNLPCTSRIKIIKKISEAWQAHDPLELKLGTELDVLIRKKYEKKDWNYKY